MGDITLDSDELKGLVKTYLRERFLLESHNVISIIMEQYDEQLIYELDSSVSTSLHPVYYKDLFYNTLSIFDYVVETEDSISFNAPDMDDFDFSGGLEIIHVILSGLVGDYVEVDSDDFMSIYNDLPEDSGDIIELPEGIYLVKRSSSINRLENILDKKFDSFPFSNIGPIDIFQEADNYVDRNLETWIDETIRRAKAMFNSKTKGVGR